MDRALYNSCIGGKLKGLHLSKEERKLEFCIVSKVCSGKAADRDAAIAACNVPKLSKWVKGAKAKEPDLPCPERRNRVLSSLDSIVQQLKSGQTEETKALAGLVMQDIFACHQDDGLPQLAKEAMDEVKDLAGRFFMSGEANDAKSKIEIIRKLLE